MGCWYWSGAHDYVLVGQRIDATADDRATCRRRRIPMSSNEMRESEQVEERDIAISFRSAKSLC